MSCSASWTNGCAGVPIELGYLRSRWSSELLALELERSSGVSVHATTVRRWLKRLCMRWRRARPTLCIRDPRKRERLRAIAHALADRNPYHEVFYVDEADYSGPQILGHRLSKISGGLRGSNDDN